ncbi:DMT family transporter [Vibrio sinaloensis]|uniref:DMT family transporter n=1 Tax=Photobacterium sp. (strain ATCC 43367) TaxID=379097 RepID=UPI00057CC9C2|nr:DMT family transporter [Vibrio sinaloensis]KHT47814.1 membrane protein [Vibrio sinaloensis]
MSNQLYPIVFMLLSTFSLSLTGLFSKFLSQQLEPSLLGFLRFFLPMSLLLVFVALPKIRIPERRLMKPFWLRAVCIGLCQICFIYSLKHLSLVESVVLFSTGPMFIPLLEKLIFSTRVRPLSILGLVITFIGVLLLAGDVSNLSLRIELLVGLAAGFFNAGSQLALYRSSKTDLNPFEINFWTFLFASVVLLPFVGVSALQQPEWIVSDSSSLMLLVAVLFALAALIINTQVFRSKAYKLAESNSQLAPLIYTNLLFTALWQWLFFDESYESIQLLGLGLIVFANVLCAFIPKWVKAIERLRMNHNLR